MVRTAQSDAIPPGEPPALASEGWLPSVLLAAAVALLIIVVLGKTRRKAINKSREILPTPEERLADLRHRAENDAGIEARVAAAADQIRELTAVLDTRIETLDVLIQQADERIQRMQQREARPNGDSRPAPPTSHAAPSTDSQKQAIYDLADQGLAPAEIASRLGQHSGKIELILALRRV
jgi:hypothetical protein